jgi:threonine synthase
MFATSLKCTACARSYPLGEHYACDSCNGVLEVTYDYQAIGSKPIAETLPEPGFNIWRYRNLLPVRDEAAMVSLLEGGTPLVKSTNLATDYEIENLYLKDETRNPSGAFKDRPIAVAVSKARELGFGTVVTASSGNGAASLAIYAAKARMRCIIFVPETTPMGKVAQATVSGATIVKVRGDYSNSFRMAKETAEHFHWMNVTTTFLNPYSFEGDKTVAYELYRQFGGDVPDWVVIPAGAGPLVYGIHKGFLEMRRLGLTDALPRMVAVQAEGCKPIARAFENGTDVSAWERVETVASAIADPLRGYEKDGQLVVRTLKANGGLALAVPDDEILAAMDDLGKKEGIYAEPGAAASIAALKRMIAADSVRSD